MEAAVVDHHANELMQFEQSSRPSRRSSASRTRPPPFARTGRCRRAAASNRGRRARLLLAQHVPAAPSALWPRLAFSPASRADWGIGVYQICFAGSNTARAISLPTRARALSSNSAISLVASRSRKLVAIELSVWSTGGLGAGLSAIQFITPVQTMTSDSQAMHLEPGSEYIRKFKVEMCMVSKHQGEIRYH